MCGDYSPDRPHEHVKVVLERDDRGFPPFEEEKICVRHVVGRVYEVVEPPTWCRHFTHLDQVKTSLRSDGTRWITSVAVEGPGWNVRVIPLRSQSLQSIVNELPLSDARFKESYGLLVGFGEHDVSRDLFDAILAGRESGEWDVDWPILPPNVRQ